MKLDYCYKKCMKGKNTGEKFLVEADSVFDAVSDFEDFVKDCFKTCPYKNEHDKPKHEMKVCCISAKARHGKDTAGEMLKAYLESKGYGVLIIHFADLLKFICTQFFGWNGAKNEAGRSLLQRVGTDIVGAKKPEYWAQFIVDFLKLFENEWDFVLIPDTRYPIEISTMEDNFDTVVLRVERPGFESNLTPEQKQHASEVSLDDYCFDAILYNDSSLEKFNEKVEWFADNFLIN